MATPGTFPDTAINDLKDYDKDAFEEGHDADEVADHSVTSHSHDEPEKTQPAAASTATDADRDVEKGDHVTTVVAGEEIKTDVAPGDPNIVFWDGPDDPQNPMNWTAGKKWANMGMCSLFTFITPLASSMFAPGVPQVLKDFSSTNQLLATFVVSVYLLGFAFGPLLVAPLSEIYGRRWMYFGSNVLFIIFTIACAVSSNLNMLVGFRFLAGCVGSTPVTIGGGTIADVMPIQKRGGAMAIYAMGKDSASSLVVCMLMWHRSTPWSCCRPSCGRLPRRGYLLAMGFLGHHHRRRCIHSPGFARHARDLRARHTRS